MNALACVCNARIVTGHAGEASGLPLLFIVPIVLALIVVAVWLAVRRTRRASGPVAREPVQPVQEPLDVPGVVEAVGVHPDARRDQQADVHPAFP